MVVLLDTNILIDYLTNRDVPSVEASKKIMELCAENKVKGYIAFHTLPTLWYVFRKDYSDERKRVMLKSVCSVLNIAFAPKSLVLSAIDDEKFGDFEDCLQDKCAVSAQCEYIITSNIKDFTSSVVKAITPEDFINRLSN